MTTASSIVPSSNSDRNENEFNFTGELEKGINRNWSVSARYHFLTNDSNRDAYDYERHIVGGYVNFFPGTVMTIFSATAIITSFSAAYLGRPQSSNATTAEPTKIRSLS